MFVSQLGFDLNPVNMPQKVQIIKNKVKRTGEEFLLK